MLSAAASTSSRQTADGVEEGKESSGVRRCRNESSRAPQVRACGADGGWDRAARDRGQIPAWRQGADGRLVASEYLLNEIETGQVPDPRLQAGDRVEVGRRR